MTYDRRLSHFDLDMKRGAQGELWVSHICELLAQRNGWIEVKTDYRWADTGRFYIELECRGRDGIWRPSGLSTTRSKAWALVLGGLHAMVVIETVELRAAVDLAARHPRNEVECTYGNNPTRGVLVYLDHVRTLAKSLQNSGRENWDQMWGRPFDFSQEPK
jgi:hypothetical protein